MVSFPAALLEDSHFEQELDTPPEVPRKEKASPPQQQGLAGGKRPLSGPERHKKGYSDMPRGSLSHELKVADQQARRSVFEPSLSDDGRPSTPPTVPARKQRTKLGQSSLGTTSVLPASKASNNNNNFSRPAPALPGSRSAVDENSNMKRQGTVQETFRSLPVYLDDKEARLKSLGLPGEPPPIAPRKKPSYETNVSQPVCIDVVVLPLFLIILCLERC